MRTQRTTAGTAIAASLVVALASVVIPPASAAPIPFHTAPSSATNADRSTEAPSGRIVWTRVSEEGSFLMTSRADGSDSRVLTQQSPGILDIDADISPDGSLVLFDREGEEGVEMIVIGIDGSNERVLDFGCVAPCFDDIIPKWGPTGMDVYFSRVMASIDDPLTPVSAVLWAGSLDGSNVHRVSPEGVEAAYEDYVARFLPSGEMVFLRLRGADLVSALFRLDLNGVEHQLTDWAIDADVFDVSPATTGPTAGLLVFETFGHHGAPDGVAQAVATVPAYCATLTSCIARTRILTSTVLDETDPRENFNPTWSDGGGSITYSRVTWGAASNPQPDSEIATMTWNGRLSHDLTSSPGFDFRPDWGPEPAH